MVEGGALAGGGRVATKTKISQFTALSKTYKIISLWSECADEVLFRGCQCVVDVIDVALVRLTGGQQRAGEILPIRQAPNGSE